MKKQANFYLYPNNKQLTKTQNIMATFEGKIKHITDVKEFTRSKLIEFVVEEDIPENSTDKKGNLYCKSLSGN